MIQLKKLLDSEDYKKNKYIEEGYVLAQLTDELIFDCWPQKEDDLCKKEAKILDIRIFNREYELHIFRGDVSKDHFEVRQIDEASGKPEDSFDRFYYIDYDKEESDKAGDGFGYTTGGGKYPLPVEKNQYLAFRIRNYIGYYEKTGSAYIKDWRIVELKEKAENGK